MQQADRYLYAGLKRGEFCYVFNARQIGKSSLRAPSKVPTNQEAAWIEQLIRTQIIENWEFNDEPEHLRTIRDRILRASTQAISLLTLYRQIWRQEDVVAVESPIQTELLLSKLVIKQQDTLNVHNYIYQRIFDENWVNRTLALLSETTKTS